MISFILLSSASVNFSNFKLNLSRNLTISSFLLFLFIFISFSSFFFSSFLSLTFLLSSGFCLILILSSLLSFSTLCSSILISFFISVSRGIGPFSSVKNFFKLSFSSLVSSFNLSISSFFNESKDFPSNFHSFTAFSEKFNFSFKNLATSSLELSLTIFNSLPSFSFLYSVKYIINFSLSSSEIPSIFLISSSVKARKDSPSKSCSLIPSIASSEKFNFFFKKLHISSNELFKSILISSSFLSNSPLIKLFKFSFSSVVISFILSISSSFKSNRVSPSS